MIIITGRKVLLKRVRQIGLGTSDERRNVGGGQMDTRITDSKMKRLIIISSLTLFPFNLLSSEQVNYSLNSSLSKSPQKIEMMEVLEEIKGNCHDQNSILRSALHLLRVILKQSSDQANSTPKSGEMKLATQISLDGLDLSKLLVMRSSPFSSGGSSANIKWCIR